MVIFCSTTGWCGTARSTPGRCSTTGKWKRPCASLSVCAGGTSFLLSDHTTSCTSSAPCTGLPSLSTVPCTSENSTSGLDNPMAHPSDRMKANKNSVATRSEEHTSELQSHVNLVCRLLLEKK